MSIGRVRPSRRLPGRLRSELRTLSMWLRTRNLWQPHKKGTPPDWRFLEKDIFGDCRYAGGVGVCDTTRSELAREDILGLDVTILQTHM
ncbi:MAG: hypothetical protein GTO12_20770 [Proteobacteria bacterium]|nr:hypothetical protein [Pseudomonadota bacterium]